MKCWLGPVSPLLRGHFGVDNVVCASETDADDYERHVGNSEMAFGAFPQAELNGAVLAEVVDAGSDRVPVECGIIGVAAEYFYDICAEVEEEVHDLQEMTSFSYILYKCRVTFFCEVNAVIAIKRAVS